LTFGRPEVQRIVPAPGVAAGELVAVAATAELQSEHPRGHLLHRSNRYSCELP